MQFFYFECFEQFLLLALCQPGSQQLCISQFQHIFLVCLSSCLVCQFLAHLVFIPHILSIFYALQSDYLSFKMFCMSFAVSERERSLGGTQYKYIYCMYNLSAKLASSYWQYVVTNTPCVRNEGDCISFCRSQLTFLYQEKDSITYVLSAEFM